VDMSWWLVLSPLWAILLLFVAEAALICRGINPSSAQEERQMRRVVGGILLFLALPSLIALLLLSLTLATPLSFSAAAICAPFIGLVSLILCCGCCAVCCAGVVASAQNGESGNEARGLYDQQRDDESTESGGAAPSAADARVDEVTVNMQDVVDLGQQLRAAARGRSADDAAPVSLTAAELQAMSIRQLKAELDARGIPRDQAVEKADLIQLVLSSQQPGGNGLAGDGRDKVSLLD